MGEPRVAAPSASLPFGQEFLINEDPRQSLQSLRGGNFRRALYSEAQANVAASPSEYDSCVAGQCAGGRQDASGWRQTAQNDLGAGRMATQRKGQAPLLQIGFPPRWPHVCSQGQRQSPQGSPNALGSTPLSWAAGRPAQPGRLSLPDFRRRRPHVVREALAEGARYIERFATLNSTDRNPAQFESCSTIGRLTAYLARRRDLSQVICESGRAGEIWGGARGSST